MRRIKLVKNDADVVRLKGEMRAVLRRNSSPGKLGGRSFVSSSSRPERARKDSYDQKMRRIELVKNDADIVR